MSYYNTDALYGGWDTSKVPGPDEQYVRYIYFLTQRVSTLQGLDFPLFYDIFKVQWHTDNCAALGMSKKDTKAHVAPLAEDVKARTMAWAESMRKPHPEMAYALCRAVISRNVRSGRPGTDTYTNYKIGMRQHRRDLRNRVLPLTGDMRKYMSDPANPYFGYAGNSQWPYDIRYARMKKRDLTPEQRAELKRRLGTKTGYAARKREEQIQRATQLWNAAMPGAFASPGIATRSRANIADIPGAVTAGINGAYGLPLNP